MSTTPTPHRLTGGGQEAGVSKIRIHRFEACSVTLAASASRLTKIGNFIRVIIIQMGILANMQISTTFALIYFEKSTHDTFNRIQIQSIESVPHRYGNPTFWARLNDIDAKIAKAIEIEVKEFTSVSMRQTCKLNEFCLDSFDTFARRVSLIIIQYSWHVRTTLSSILFPPQFFGFVFNISNYIPALRVNFSFQRKIWHRENCDVIFIWL